MLLSANKVLIIERRRYGFHSRIMDVKFEVWEMMWLKYRVGDDNREDQQCPSRVGKILDTIIWLEHRVGDDDQEETMS